MSDRLNELQRQRALLQEHLAWLDREIVATQRGTQELAKPSPLPPTPALSNEAIAPTVSAANPRPFADAAAAERAAEEIMAQYQNEGKNLQSSVRRGCFMYFFLALGILTLGVMVLYFLRTNR